MKYVDRRREEILAELAKGRTLQVVGDRFGLTKQRVHQIAGSVPKANRAVPATPDTLRHIARALRRAWMPNFALTIDDAADQLERLHPHD